MAAPPPDLEDTMKHWIVVFSMLLYAPVQFAQQADESALIRALLVNSYVDGIYVIRDEIAILEDVHYEIGMKSVSHRILVQFSNP